MYSLLLFLLLFATSLSSCSQTPQAEPVVAFRLPDVPDALRTPEERADFLALHYWDHYNFNDTTLISRPEISEQAFVDFVSILPYASVAEAAADTLYRRSAACKPMLDYFVTLASKYLYEPNSPLHNEELYIHFLRAIVDHPALSEAERERPRHRLTMALKNRPGDVATDFSFRLRNGRTSTLHKQKAERILLYFNDPECEDCRRVKNVLAASSLLEQLMTEGRLALLAICTEGNTPAWQNASYPSLWIDGCDTKQTLIAEDLYDLKAMPTLYLLDTEKRVILKDAPAERILEELQKGF